MDEMQSFAAGLDRYRAMTGQPMVASLPLERDTLRRFVQAIMDTDPTYFDAAAAGASKFGGIVAPPLYPVHAFRPPAGGADPLDLVRADPDADGSGGSDGVFFGLEPIVSPFKRLLNGGNEIEFFRCLAVGETCVATARYADIQLKHGKSGTMLVVAIETTFRTDAGDLLLINKQTLIWR
jgi:hypothetical protein